jgi:DNA modification methylase
MNDSGRPELVWPGRVAARARAQAAIDEAQPLRPVERLSGTLARDAKRASAGATRPGEGRRRNPPGRWRNRLIHGDNLPAMAALLGEFAGRIDLIYLDPPFATGNVFGFSRAAVQRGPKPQGTAYRDTWGGTTSGSAIASWLDMMLPRLELMRALLSDRGSLYVHVDHRTVAHLRLLLDEIFGADAMRGWLVWHTGSGAKGRRRWSQQHNDLLCYAKGPHFAFHPKVPEMREPFAATSRAMHFDRTDEGGRRFRERIVNGRRYVYWADQGRLVGSVWTDCPSMAANSPIIAESTGYPTQKPEKLLRRILAASSEEGDLVADFFCGSGTTLAVAEQLGRRWIGCDLGSHAVQIARARLLARPAHAPFDLLCLDADEANVPPTRRDSPGRSTTRTRVPARIRAPRSTPKRPA